jgi:hypothetical protein
MMSASAPYFFMSYSREDVNLQQRIIAELRGRGIKRIRIRPFAKSTSCAWMEQIDAG